MSTLITVVHVIVCIFLMLTVLLQSGKGGMGAAFGGGGTQTVFGGSGAGGFLRKATVVAAVTFMLTSMTLAWIGSRTGTDALKRFSAQQRHAAKLKKQAHEDALKAGERDAGAADETTGDGDTGEATDEGGEVSTTDETGEPAAPPDESATDEAPPPIEPAKPADEAAQPASRAPPVDPPTPD